MRFELLLAGFVLVLLEVDLCQQRLDLVFEVGLQFLRTHNAHSFVLALNQLAQFRYFIFQIVVDASSVRELVGEGVDLDRLFQLLDAFDKFDALLPLFLDLPVQIKDSVVLDSDGIVWIEVV